MIRLHSVAATAALVVTAATPAFAQNNKPIRSGSFYEDRAMLYSGSSSAVLTFGQTPSDKFFNVSDVTCYFFTQTTASELEFAKLLIGTTSGVNDTGRYFNVAGNATVASTQGTYINITNKTYIKIGPGRYPSISYQFKSPAAGTYGECTIVGTLSDD